MQKINFKSDIKIIESYPSTDDFVYHFTTDEKTCYDVSLEIGNCRKAEPECCGKAKLIICLDNHGLGVGQLKVRRELRYTDDDMPDGVYNKITENKYDIFLVKGASTEVEDIEVDGYLPIFRGDKGDAYEITEDDYEAIAELAATKVDLSDYYTKEEVEELFGEKLQYYSEGEDNASIRVANNGNYSSSVNVEPTRVHIEHTGSQESHNGRIQINNNGIFFSHEGDTDAKDINVAMYDGKLYVNEKAVAIADIGETVNWQTFNSALYKPEVGWKRVIKQVTPGQTAGYTGFAFTQRYGANNVMQIFFVDNSTTILYRDYTFSLGEAIDVEWKTLQKNYTSGTGITVADNGTINLTQVFKTINSESVEGTGNIAVQTPLNHYSEGEDYASITVDTNTLVLGRDNFTLNGKEIALKEDIPEEYDDTEVRQQIENLDDKFEYVNNQVNTIRDKVNELELFKFPNTSIFGNPTINQGQVSNFSEDNYLQMPFVVDVQNRPYKIEFDISTGEDVTTQQNIIDSEYGLAIAIRDAKIVVAISSNGTSWDGEYVTDAFIQPESTYHVTVEQINDFLGVIVNYGRQLFDFTDIQGYPYPKQIIIGKGVTEGHVFTGSINLNYAKLTIQGQVVWSGMDDVGISTRLATDLSNLDAAGEAKIKGMIDTKQDKIEGFFQDGMVTEIKPNDDAVSVGQAVISTMGAALEYLDDEGEYVHTLRVLPNGAFYDNKEIATKDYVDEKADYIVWSGTQEEYDALEDKSQYKVYLIQDDNT